MLLYKYRGLSSLEHTLDILVRNQLYCAEYEELNDPLKAPLTSGAVSR